MIEEDRRLTNMTISQEFAAFNLGDRDENVPHKGKKKKFKSTPVTVIT